MLRRIVLSLTLIATLPVFAQTNDTTVHTAVELQHRADKLMEAAKATPTGLATEIFDNLGNYYTMLIVRVHTGDSERHQLWADQIVILKGTVTLVTGGTMLTEHPGAAPGETRGSGIEGGTETVLHPGDIAHVPANLPHWVKLPPGSTATYLAFKEK